MATAIYHGFLMHSLAVLVANGQSGKVTANGFVVGWALGFDIICLLALGSIFVG